MGRIIVNWYFIVYNKFYYKLFDLSLKFERTKYAAWGEGQNKQKEVYYVDPRYAKRSHSTKSYQRLSDTKYKIDYGTDVITNIETFSPCIFTSIKFFVFKINGSSFALTQILSPSSIISNVID